MQHKHRRRVEFNVMSKPSSLLTAKGARLRSVARDLPLEFYHVTAATEPVPLLKVDRLSVEISTRWGRFRAADGVTFSVLRGETLGIVGESGSGKSITCLSILGLLPKGGSIIGGSITFDDLSLTQMSQHEIRRIRGRRIAMILQDPMVSLNPVLSIGTQVAAPIRLHQRQGKAAAWQRAAAMLGLLRIPAPTTRLDNYPHQMSGGMRQRVCGAIALSCEPELLIADEPTTSLDVTIQAQYLELLADIRKQRNVAMIFVTHDLGVVAQMCDRVAVMYAGRIIELVDVAGLFDHPAHPYTRALLASLPDPDAREHRLRAIEGAPPQPGEIGAGCAFAPRCASADAHCRAQSPPTIELSNGHTVACWKPHDTRH